MITIILNYIRLKRQKARNGNAQEDKRINIEE